MKHNIHYQTLLCRICVAVLSALAGPSRRDLSLLIYASSLMVYGLPERHTSYTSSHQIEWQMEVRALSGEVVYHLKIDDVLH